MNRPTSLCSVALPVVLLMATLSAPRATAERWTSLHSSRTVEAQFIGLWGESVVLQLEDERRVTVDINQLVAESRILARELGEKQRQRRQELVDGIRSDAAAASAPAPDPLPRPRSAPAYRQFSGGGGLLERLEWWEDQINNGHLVLSTFDSLPPSYQADVERLAKKAIAKTNVAAASQGVSAVHTIGEFIVTRQRWLFSHPRLNALPEEVMDPVKQSLLAFGGFLRDGLNPDDFDLEDLRSGSLRGWLAGLDQRTAPHLFELMELARSAGFESSFEVLSENGDQATFSVDVLGNKQAINAVLVEGVWLPAELNRENWTKMIQEAEAQLDQAADGSVGANAYPALLVLSVFMQPAMNAKSAGDLHKIMDGWLEKMAPAMPAIQSQLAGMQMMGGMAGGPGGPGGGPGARGNAGGYGNYDEYEDSGEGMEDEMSGYEEEMMEDEMMEDEMGSGF